MIPKTEWPAIIVRIERLERQNRRLKTMGALVVIVAASLLLMGQASPQKTIEANEFVLTDMSGNVRAQLSTGLFGPKLVFMDSKGTQRLVLNGNEAGSHIDLLDGNGKTRAELTAINSVRAETIPSGTTWADLQSNSAPALLFYNRAGDLPLMSLEAADQDASLTLRHMNGNKASINTNSRGPFIELTDQQREQTTIGSIDLLIPEKGRLSKTSAASIVLLDKDKNVMWQVP